MSDGIFNGQEVTSADLNNIAIDLGNTSFNGFGNEKFGASLLNSITSSLITSGVLLSGNMLRPTLLTNTSGYQGYGISVSDGTAVFSDGSKKTISSSTVLPLPDGNTDFYVWMQNNPTEGTASLMLGTEFPAEGDIVKIAWADITSTKHYTHYELIDQREFCNAKTTFTNVGTGIEKTAEIVQINDKGYNFVKYDSSVFFKREYLICIGIFSDKINSFAIPISKFNKDTIAYNSTDLGTEICKVNDRMIYARYANEEKTEIEILGNLDWYGAISNKVIIIGGAQSEQSN